MTRLWLPLFRTHFVSSSAAHVPNRLFGLTPTVSNPLQPTVTTNHCWNFPTRFSPSNPKLGKKQVLTFRHWADSPLQPLLRPTT